MASLSKKRILIIDDMKDIRILVRTILETDGAEVYEAETIDEGIAIAAKKTPQLVITDLKMPDKTGFDLLKELKGHEFLNRVPVIVLSGLQDKDSVMGAIGLGALDYVIKPIKASFLLQKVRKALNSIDFLSYTLTDKDEAQASVSVKVEVLSANEVGLQVESFVRFAGTQPVTLSGEIIEQIGCEDVVTRTSKEVSVYKNSDRYSTHLNFIGLSTELSKQIRKNIGELK
jgi:DNA-binding response OmpR family regulator